MQVQILPRPQPKGDYLKGGKCMNDKCVAQAPHPPMRECISIVADELEKANDILESIEDKLFGLNSNEQCDNANPPQTVQNGIDRAGSATRQLLNRLDSINSRL